MSAASDETPLESVRLSVAVLDDDGDYIEYVSGVLAGLGHAVRGFRTAGELFAACAEALPDVVLLDMNMGPSRGADVLDELRERWPRLCVIVVTGYPSLDTMRETFKRDAFDYLSKPFAEADLARVLAQAAEAFGLGRRPQDRLRQELGRSIRLARTNRAWTLRDLSEASGVSVSQLSSVERGAHMPSLESLLAISAALETVPSRWLAESGF
jgi:FixJ family two-component response regulator